MAKTIQRDGAPRGADDSYERATAFLSHWIEDSFLIPTSKIGHQDQQHQRWFSQPEPDIPLPSVRLSRRNTYSNSSDGGSNDGSINSLVNSLQTSLMSHGHQNHIRPSSQRGITSPSSISTVYEPSSGGILRVPPLPFDGRPTATQQQQARNFQQDESASSRRSVAASTRSTRRSGNEGERGRRLSVGGDIARPQSSHITKGHGSKHHCSSNNKDENSSKRPPTRRHTFDSDRSFTSSNKSCACISPQNQTEGRSASRQSCLSASCLLDELDEGVLSFCASLSSLHDDRRRTTSRRHSHCSNRSDDDLPSPSLHRRNHADCRKEDPPTMVVSLPWIDLAGNEGHYTGEVNASIQPHGFGALQYDSGTVVTGLWNNGSPTTSTSSTSKDSQVPSPGKRGDENEIIETSMQNDGTPSSKRDNENKSASKTENRPKTKILRKNSRRYTKKAMGGNPSYANTAKSISSTQPSVQPSLGSLSELNGPPDFDLGDTYDSTKYQVIESNPSKALNLINQLRIHDFAWVLRSSRKWTYAIIADFPVEGGEEASIRFVIDKLGNTKTLKMKHWAKCIRLVDVGQKMT